jgi:hypothetical protein
MSILEGNVMPNVVQNTKTTSYPEKRNWKLLDKKGSC